MSNDERYTRAMKKVQTLLEKCFKNSKGDVVLFQWPNPPIITWGMARVLAWVTSGNLKEFFNLLAFGALFTWAWLEIFQGANYFRRLLGLLVLVITLYVRLG